MNIASEGRVRKPGWQNGPVFPELVDRRAFLDKVVLSIWGKRKKDGLELDFNNVSRQRIGGIGRNYGWAENGVLANTGNPFQLKFGVLRLRGIIPPMHLTVWSERSPVTIVELEWAVRNLCAEAWKLRVSQLELTFDLSGFSVDYFRRNILTRSQKRKDFKDESGRQTHYVSGRNAPWQVTVYDKPGGVCRFEWRLRRPLLRESGIEITGDLEKLRYLDLSGRVRIAELNESALPSMETQLLNAVRDEGEIREDAMRRIIFSRCQILPLRTFLPWARFAQWPIPDDLIPARSTLDDKLSEMQQNLVL